MNGYLTSGKKKKKQNKNKNKRRGNNEIHVTTVCVSGVLNSLS